MKIQAELRFRHARVAEILKDTGTTIKALAAMSGWNPNVLGQFIRLRPTTITAQFKRYGEGSRSLLRALQHLDPTLTHEELYPPELPKAVEVFSPQRNTKDIDVLALTDASVDLLSTELILAAMKAPGEPEQPTPEPAGVQELPPFDDVAENIHERTGHWICGMNAYAAAHAVYCACKLILAAPATPPEEGVDE